jgi:hypothetical protein
LWNVNSTPGIYVDIAVINYAKFMKCTKQKNVAVLKIGLQFLYKKKIIKNMLINENKLINKTPLRFKSQLSVVNGIRTHNLSGDRH